MVIDVELFRLIRGLLVDLASTDVVELVYETADTKILVRKDPAISAVAPLPLAAPPSPPPADSPHLASPLTGVFYRTSKPNAPPFVIEGEHIEAGRVVGLIEAMKVFNEIRVEEPCRVRAFLIASGELVHKGQPLLTLEKE